MPEPAQLFFGREVANAGDANGDGIDDLLIGAPGHDFGGTDAGSAYLLFGSTRRGPAVLRADAINGETGTRLDGVEAAGFCAQVFKGAGDLNGDGRADLAVGCNLASGGGRHRGITHVVFGNAAPRVARPRLALADQRADAVEIPTYTVAALAHGNYLDDEPLAGAAITEAPLSALGHWKFRYRSDDDFEPLPEDLSDANAALLGPDAEIRFVPEGGASGVAAPLALRFWDGHGGYVVDMQSDLRADFGGLGGFAAADQRLWLDLTVRPASDPSVVLFSDGFDERTNGHRNDVPRDTDPGG